MQLAAIGDSKTVGGPCCVDTGAFRPELVASLQATGLWPSVSFSAVNSGGVLAYGGKTTAEMAAYVPGWLDEFTHVDLYPDFVLINLGSNDLLAADSGVLTQSAWVASMGGILDNLHAKFPEARLLLMRVYFDQAPTGMTRLNDTWIPAVLSGRESYAAVGPDERDFYPGNLCDIIHPNLTACTLTAAGWFDSIVSFYP